MGPDGQGDPPTQQFIIGLGANLGARLASLRCACQLLALDGAVTVLQGSRVYDTEPVGPRQPRFLNAAVRIATRYSPLELLALTQRVETALGRTRHNTVRWGPRNLDLDILDSDTSFRCSRLEIPHPELARRPFALAPLHDLIPARAEAFGYNPRASPTALPDTLWPAADAPPGPTATTVQDGAAPAPWTGQGLEQLDACAAALMSVSRPSLGIGHAYPHRIGSLREAAEHVLSLRQRGIAARAITLTANPDDTAVPLTVRVFGGEIDGGRLTNVTVQDVLHSKADGSPHHRIKIRFSS